MNASKALGRLRRVDLRQYWLSESTDFTPWLARPENMSLLAESLEMELEVQTQEHRVGVFRADIVCMDISDQTKVLIENQLERTDHGHLGRLLTYAAGLEAVTIIWIAERFSEEHRAALDWLNRMTHDSVNFFGLEIELWAIDNSVPAPKFNVVVKPNEWTNVVGRVEGLSETDQLYLEYWTSFKQHLESAKSPVRMGKPLPQGWMTFAIGRSSFLLEASVSKQSRTARAQLVIYEPNRLERYELLRADETAINAELGPDVEWRRLDEKKESHIRRSLQGADPADRVRWAEQHQWMRNALESMLRTLGPRVKSLTVSENREASST